MTKKNKKKYGIIIVIFVGLVGIIIVGFLFYFDKISLFQQTYWPPSEGCTPPSCDSGYTPYGSVTCERNGLTVTCEQECRREESCGSYGPLLVGTTKSVSWKGADDRGTYFYTPISFFLSSSSCYQYYTEVSMSDISKGSTDSLAVFSYRSHVPTFGVYDCIAPPVYDPLKTITVTFMPGDDDWHLGSGRAFDYKDTICSDDNFPIWYNSLDGTFNIKIMYKKATYYPASTYYETCNKYLGCAYDSDCDNDDGWYGSTSCQGGDVWGYYRTYFCDDDYECDYDEQFKKKQNCPYECSGGVCSGETCTPESDTTFCTRLDKECGTVTGNDNCGDSRTVNCGTCSTGYSCISNQCVADEPTEEEYIFLNITVKNIDSIDLDIQLWNAMPDDFKNSLKNPEQFQIIHVLNPGQTYNWKTKPIDISGYTETIDYQLWTKASGTGRTEQDMLTTVPISKT